MQGPDPAFIAPMVVSIVFFVSTAAVLIFRPLTKRLGDRIAGAKQVTPPAVDEGELLRLHQALEETSARLELLEQRLDFTERLLRAPRAAPELGRAVPGGLPPAAAPGEPGRLPPNG